MLRRSIENKGVKVTPGPRILVSQMLSVKLLLMRGGAILKLFRVLSMVALLAFAVSVARADSGGDGHPKLGGSGPGSPNCNSFQASTDADGGIDNLDCTVNTQTATTIVFAVPDAGTITQGAPNGGLTCSASQLVAIGWTQNANVQTTVNGVLTDECSFTAPTASQITLKDIANAVLESALTPTGNSTCQCNWNDFIFGIPVGCDITVTTAGDPSNQLFAPNTSFDVAPSTTALVPFPEPGTIWLMLFGFAGLFFVQRKMARRSMVQSFTQAS